ncbi:hypothetical protein HJ581_0008240 [Rhodococcus opacus]|nr:hypothetical protein HJ581_0008240 [Rhodococcus opacus]
MTKTTYHEGKYWTVGAIRRHPIAYAELHRPDAKSVAVPLSKLKIEEPRP